jgi:phosphatidylserine/phosphatidylglycerophosphate/cardiolipin synthase-like enzyme
VLTCRPLAVLPLLVAAVLVGCAAPPESDDTEEDNGALAEVDAPLGDVGKSVVHALQSNAKLRILQGKTWEVTAGNTLPEGWLLPTTASSTWGDKLASLPTGTDCKAGDANCDPDFLLRTCKDDGGCPSGSCRPFGPSVTADGQAPKKMCLGYADWFEEAFYDAIVRAKEHVDISSLWLPTDRFAPAIRNGLLRLASRRGPPVTVRILSGDASDFGPLAKKSTSAALALITKGLPADAPLTIYVAEESAAMLSWNHSKIIAVDGESSMAGGHNMHTADYQLKDPVSDLSMKLTGPAAGSAHKYLNQVWDVGCKRGTLHGFGLVSFPANLPCPKHYEPKATAGSGDTSVIAVGRLGAVKDNPSDDALLAMVDAAKETVVMSQEDILGGRIPKTNLSVAAAPKALIERLAAAIGRGVDVYLVTSNVDGGLFTTSYSHGWSEAETAQQMADIMKARKDLFPPDTDIVALLCEKLHVAGLRLADADRWADGKVFSNHAKFLMVDAKAFYVGSQNLYVSDLAEFGYIVDSEKAAQEAHDTFWAPLWRFSKRSAASGSEAKTCALRK